MPKLRIPLKPQAGLSVTVSHSLFSADSLIDLFLQNKKKKRQAFKHAHCLFNDHYSQSVSLLDPAPNIQNLDCVSPASGAVF